MFKERRLINHRERSESEPNEERLRPRDRRLQRREDRIELRNSRQNNRAEEQLARIDNAQEERAQDRQNDAEERALRLRQRQERQRLRHEIERTNEEESTTVRTREELNEFERVTANTSQVARADIPQRESRPNTPTRTTAPTITSTESTERTPVQNQIREYRLKVEEHMGGFLGGIFNFLGVDSEQLAIQLAANGENLEEIGFFSVIAAAFSLKFNQLFNKNDVAESSDIELDPNGEVIRYRTMDNDEWALLTDDEEDATFSEDFNNLKATTRLNIAETHEIFIPTGTKINNLSRDLVATKISDNSIVRINEGESWTAPDGGVVIRHSNSISNNETYENYIPNETLFQGPITYRPVTSTPSTSASTENLQVQDLLESYMDSTISNRESHSDAFSTLNQITSTESIDITLNIDTTSNRRLFISDFGVLSMKILESVNNYIEQVDPTVFGLTTEQFTEPVKAMLANELGNAISANYLPLANSQNQLDGTHQLSISLTKNQLTSLSERRLMYSVNSLTPSFTPEAN